MVNKPQKNNQQKKEGPVPTGQPYKQQQEKKLPKKEIPGKK